MLFVTNVPWLKSLVDSIKLIWGITITPINKEKEVGLSNEEYKENNFILVVDGNIEPETLNNLFQKRRCEIICVIDPNTSSPHLNKTIKLSVGIRVIQLPENKVEPQLFHLAPKPPPAKEALA